MALAVASRSHDGYVRKSAVEQLVGRTEPWLGVYLLVALGDMVAQTVAPIAQALKSPATAS